MIQYTPIVHPALSRGFWGSRKNHMLEKAIVIKISISKLEKGAQLGDNGVLRYILIIDSINFILGTIGG